jgi:hypothetical protein
MFSCATRTKSPALVQTRIDSYDELEHPAFVVTLDQRSKKSYRRRRAGSGREKPFDFAACATLSYSAQRVSPRIVAPESS